jgi:hypothetical protein
MGKKSRVRKNTDSTPLLLFIYRSRVPILTITLAGFILSVVISLVITPRYRSAVIMYPATFTSMSRSLMGPSETRGDIMDFGREADTERLLQVLHSETIRRGIINKFDLMSHYGIKEGSRFPYTALNRKFDSNVRFRKTPYMAIEIEVLDADPAIAAAMANDIALYLDSVMSFMFRERAVMSLAVVEQEYIRLQEEVRMLEDSLKRIREMGVINYEAQSEVINNAYATAILGKDSVSEDFFRGRLRLLSAYGGAYVSIRDYLSYRHEKLNEMKAAYDEARINAGKIIPYKYVIENAGVAEKKTYPVRSLIVGISTISAFLLALFMVLLTDAFRRQILHPGSHNHRSNAAR